MTLTFFIKLDQKLDLKCFKEAFNENPNLVQQMFPQIKTPNDIEAAIKYVYGDTDENKKLISTKDFLLNNEKLLQEIAEVISKELNYPWDKRTITVLPSTSPVFHRFIDSSTFMVPYFWPKNSIIRVFIHEMVHLLYFKKLQDISSEIIDTEYPSNDWLISEIVAPIIVNTKSLQYYCNEQDTFFSIDKDVVSSNLIREASLLFKNEPDLLKFRKLAIKKLKVLI